MLQLRRWDGPLIKAVGTSEHERRGTEQRLHPDLGTLEQFCHRIAQLQQAHPYKGLSFPKVPAEGGANNVPVSLGLRPDPVPSSTFSILPELRVLSHSVIHSRVKQSCERTLPERLTLLRALCMLSDRALIT